jgi:hypothetical protein
MSDKQTRGTIKRTGGNEMKNTNCPTDTEPDTTSPADYGNLESPKSGSKLRWKQPATVRQFASQVNAVATKVLNGSIDMDKARAYATLTRVLAQAISVEVTRARFVKQVPDLVIDDLMEEDNGDQ